jgi:hypothetical protein|nr:MAG TPA: hypothetical protein [Caudoviricetes sp.]
MELTKQDVEMLRSLEKFNMAGCEKDSKLYTLLNMPPVVERILNVLKKEEGLTYVGAYAALEIAYKRLLLESNFVSPQK